MAGDKNNEIGGQPEMKRSMLRPHTVPFELLYDEDTLIWSVIRTIEYQDEQDSSSFERLGPYEYLYKMDAVAPEFWNIEYRMAQLNDFCVLCMSATDFALKELEHEWNQLNSGSKKIIDEDGQDTTGEEMTILGDTIPGWKDTNQFLVRAMCLVLLSAFLEESLRSLCKAFAPEARLPKQKTSEAKVMQYLKFLREDCQVEFEIAAETNEMLDNCRRVRNEFAHGDWEAVKRSCLEIPLRRAFSVVADLLYAIDDGAWKSPWARVKHSQS